MLENFLDLIADKKARDVVTQFLNLNQNHQEAIVAIAKLSRKNQEELGRLVSMYDDKKDKKISTIRQTDYLTYTSARNTIETIPTAYHPDPESGIVTKAQFNTWLSPLPEVVLLINGKEKLMLKRPKKHVKFVKSYLNVVCAEVEITHVVGRKHEVFMIENIHFNIGQELNGESFGSLVKRIHDKLNSFQTTSFRNRLVSGFDLSRSHNVVRTDDMPTLIEKFMKLVKFDQRFRDTLNSVTKDVGSTLARSFELHKGFGADLFHKIKFIGEMLGSFIQVDHETFILGSEVSPSLLVKKKDDSRYTAKIAERKEETATLL